MAVRRGLAQDSAYGRGKAHVSHAVGFVHNHRGHGVEIEVVLFEEVFEASRTCDDDVGTHLK